MEQVKEKSSKQIFIIKRDGRRVPFDKNKIINAIELASASANDGVVSEYLHSKAINITNYIYQKALISEKELAVEDIQDLVQNGLMNTKAKNVAAHYIIYRNDRTRFRFNQSNIMQRVSSKINGTNNEKQNANVDELSFGGKKGEAANVILKQFALDNTLSPRAAYYHLANLIYWHDLDSVALGMHNCLSIPFDDILAKGFNSKIDVRPANSINTAFQLLAVIFQIQSLQQYGGVSATHLDWTMVPYVRKSFRKHYIVAILKDSAAFENLDLLEMLFDDYEDEAGIIRNKFDDWIDENKDEILEKYNLKDEDFKFDNKEGLNRKYYQQALYDTMVETKQAVEGMYHNLNTLLSRSGNQLPFSSINYGTCTSPEGRFIIKALLDGCIKGVGALHRTSIFPCSIFQLGKGINRKPGDPNYDLYKLALKCTARRLYPNYANIDWSGNEGYDPNDPKTIFSTMGKRKLQPM